MYACEEEDVNTEMVKNNEYDCERDFEEDDSDDLSYFMYIFSYSIILTLLATSIVFFSTCFLSPRLQSNPLHVHETTSFFVGIMIGEMATFLSSLVLIFIFSNSFAFYMSTKANQDKINNFNNEKKKV